MKKLLILAFLALPQILAAQLCEAEELISGGQPFDFGSCKNQLDDGLITSLSPENTARFDAWNAENFAHSNSGFRRRENFEAKQKQFYTGQRDWAKVWKDWGWDTLNLMATTGITHGINQFTTYRTRPRPVALGLAPPADPAPHQDVLGYAIAAPVSGLIGNSIRTYRESKRDLTEGLKLAHAELKLESEQFLTGLPADIQWAVQSSDNRITTLLEQKQGDMAFKVLSRREEVYLALPIKPLNVSHKNKKSGDPEIKRILDQRVHDLINRYPDDQQSTLKLLISSIRENSIRSKGERVQAYLYGPPGTGKTTFVKLLAKTLGLPLCVINLGGLDMNELLGPPFADDWHNEGNAKVTGKLTQCFIDAGYSNPIVFFDEAGEFLVDSGATDPTFNDYKKQTIQAEFKKITDTSVQKFAHTALKIEIDTSRATYLFASNFSLDNSALLRRMMQITFPSLTHEQKVSAANFAFRKVICTQGELYEESEVEKIRTITESYLPFILAEDERRNPGASILQQVIQEFVIHVKGLLEEGVDLPETQSNITDELLRDRIINSFSLREVKKQEPALAQP